MINIRTFASCCTAISLLIGCAGSSTEQQAGDELTPDEQTLAVIERGNRLELPTQYVPPPGDPEAHFTMGFARTLCSGVFVSGLDEGFAAQNIGFFTSPLETRDVVVQRNADYEAKTVTLTTNSGISRTAKYIGDMGCVPLPIGEREPFFEPPVINTSLPDAKNTHTFAFTFYNVVDTFCTREM